MKELQKRYMMGVKRFVYLVLIVLPIVSCDQVSTETSEDNKPGVQNAVPSHDGLKIAYVQIDSIINNYELFHELSSQLEEKQKQSEAELNTKSRQLETNMKDFQNKVQKGLVTRATAAQMEQDLLAEQQNLVQLRDNLSMQLAEQEQVMNRQLINEISEYLKVFNKDETYDFIFSYSFGTNLLYTNKAYDITAEVLKGLNERHKSTGK